MDNDPVADVRLYATNTDSCVDTTDESLFCLQTRDLMPLYTKSPCPETNLSIVVTDNPWNPALRIKLRCDLTKRSRGVAQELLGELFIAYAHLTPQRGIARLRLCLTSHKSWKEGKLC